MVGATIRQLHPPGKEPWAHLAGGWVGPGASLEALDTKNVASISGVGRIVLFASALTELHQVK